MWFT